MGVAFVHRNGVIGFAQRQPRNALRIATAPLRRLRSIVEVVARHAYDGKTLLVPGIPEAETEQQAFAAAHRFREQVLKRLSAVPA